MQQWRENAGFILSMVDEINAVAESMRMSRYKSARILARKEAELLDVVSRIQHLTLRLLEKINADIAAPLDSNNQRSANHKKIRLSLKHIEDCASLHEAGMERANIAKKLECHPRNIGYLLEGHKLPQSLKMMIEKREIALTELLNFVRKHGPSHSEKMLPRIVIWAKSQSTFSLRKGDNLLSATVIQAYFQKERDV